MTPSRLPAETQAAVAAETRWAARALGLTEGPVHAELRVAATAGGAVGGRGRRPHDRRPLLPHASLRRRGEPRGARDPPRARRRPRLARAGAPAGRRHDDPDPAARRAAGHAGPGRGAAPCRASRRSRSAPTSARSWCRSRRARSTWASSSPGRTRPRRSRRPSARATAVSPSTSTRPATPAPPGVAPAPAPAKESLPVKLVLYPPVEPERLAKVVEAARPMTVVNARDEAEARREIADADAFFGKLTPALLGAARRLRWVQAPTASLEHYMFPELVAHPSALTNMRGLYSDVIADHVFGYVLCFARNFHHYIRNQLEARWAPVGGRGRPSCRASSHRPGDRERRRPGPSPPGGRHARRRRPGPDRVRDRAAGARVRDAGPRRGPRPDGGAARAWRRSGAWTG